ETDMKRAELGSEQNDGDMRIAVLAQGSQEVDPHRARLGERCTVRSGNGDGNGRTGGQLQHLRLRLGDAAEAAREILVVEQRDRATEGARGQRDALSCR